MRTLTALLFAAAIAAGTAMACSCSSRKPFCEAPPESAELKDRVIFVGTVESVAPSGDGIFPRIARLRVDESFVGSPSPSFDVLAGTGECCDCSPRFAAGEKYLVVAKRRMDRWSTSICTGTSLVEDAAEEIAALRSWKSGAPAPATIRGSIDDRTRRDNVLQIAGLRVVLRGADGDRETRTGARGNFEFAGLAQAKYQITLPLAGWTVTPAASEVDLTGRTCAQAHFVVRNKQSTVRGRLYTPSGAPAPSLIVEAISLAPVGNRPGIPSNESGEFTIDRLEPGEYIFGIHVSKKPPGATLPATYFPGVSDPARAQRFRIERGQTLELPLWTLPAQ